MNSCTCEAQLAHPMGLIGAGLAEGRGHRRLAAGPTPNRGGGPVGQGQSGRGRGRSFGPAPDRGGQLGAKSAREEPREVGRSNQSPSQASWLPQCASLQPVVPVAWLLNI